MNRNVSRSRWSAGARLAAVLVTTAACGAGAQVSGPDTHPDLPSEFRQIIPRGQIASIDDPVFVKPDDAEISDDAWIFGVVVDGQARAYSINILNSHEIVNDSVGGKNFAAVW